MKSKQQLRKWAKEERKKIDINDLSRVFVQKIRALDEYKNSENIMIFYPLKNEVNLLALLEDSTKRFYLPKIDGDNLLCCPYESGMELCESCFKTKEPLTEPVQKDLIDLIIAPALAVDKNNYRLGYGGGFYDRFLIKTTAIKMVCVSEKLLIETVYPENHDIKVDKVITA